MLGNFIDHRTDRQNPNIDAVFEPSIHDQGRQGGERYFEPDDTLSSDAYFAVTWQYRTTVREAVLRAEHNWPFPVTVYAYEAGSSPAG